MIGYWISFALIFIAIPFGVVGLKRWALKDKILTPEQEKIGNTRLGLLIFFYWVCDLLYMSCFINNMVCQYIFGGLIMLVILMNVYNAVSQPKEKTGFERWGILQDFIIGVGISIYLIYIIPNADVKEIVIPIVAAIYGGVLTLVGVSLTIRKADKDRKEDETKKAQPIFAFNMLSAEPIKQDFKKACFPMLDDELDKKCVVYVELENSNLSSFTMKKIYRDSEWLELVGNLTLIPENKCILSYGFNEPFNMYLEVEDVLGKLHYYECKPLIMPTPGTSSPTKDSSGKIFHTLRSLREISKEDMEKNMQEAK